MTGSDSMSKSRAKRIAEAQAIWDGTDFIEEDIERSEQQAEAWVDEAHRIMAAVALADRLADDIIHGARAEEDGCST